MRYRKVCYFHFSIFPRAPLGSGTSNQVDPGCGIKGPWYPDIMCEENCQLLNSIRRYCNTIVGSSSAICMFFHEFYQFSSGDLISQCCAQTTSSPTYVLRVHTSVPNISLSHPITPLGLGTSRPPCGRFGFIPNHGLTWRPCHSQKQGVWSMPKRYVGHLGRGSTSGAYSGPSRTYAPFAATMSVRIFGHFLPFPIFLAPRPLCPAPPCMPDAWTNGPYMVCSLCTLIPMSHTPRG